ncbi:hypothetical protein RJ640_022079 [Escallonia rubra]|uniref:Uncharacterized protein n=1 Tax=Escallonia rubra TaxID=112253 RepID=A0AA88QSF8_9ASTE|nr:hypothetical protein RJ640_022079 [Escallonia rubra]
MFLFVGTGTTINYFLDGNINIVVILFPGVGCFLIVVCLGSVIHASNAADNKVKLLNLENCEKDGTGLVALVWRRPKWVALMVAEGEGRGMGGGSGRREEMKGKEGEGGDGPRPKGEEGGGRERKGEVRGCSAV